MNRYFWACIFSICIGVVAMIVAMIMNFLDFKKDKLTNSIFKVRFRAFRH